MTKESNSLCLVHHHDTTLQNLFGDPILNFLHLSILAISLMGVPKGQIIQMLQMILTILSAPWKEPMLVHIKAKDHAHILKYLNLCTTLLPEEFWHELDKMMTMRGKTIIVTSWAKKNLAALEEIFEAFMKGEVGLLGILPDTHPVFSSYATMEIDLDADTSGDFNQLLSYMEEASGFPITQFLNQCAGKSVDKVFIENYKKICNNLKSEKNINVNDDSFLKSINTLTGAILEQNTIRALLRNVTRFNHAHVNTRDLAITYDSQNDIEVPLLVATDVDYAIFSPMIKSTLLAWERKKLGFTEEEILIIKIVEPRMKWIITIGLDDDEIKKLSAKDKADKVAFAANLDYMSSVVEYSWPDDSRMEDDLKALGCHMNYNERQKCYKSLEDRGILIKKKSRSKATRYGLLRFDLLKDAKFYNNRKFEETLMLGDGE
jgi:hypothetical protein